MRKPAYVSHYLVLRDLIEGIDVRQYSDSIVYLTSRIENIKNDLKNKDGLRFDEDARAESKYAHYKQYVLERDAANMALAEQLLKRYGTDKVLRFLEGAAA